MSVSNIQDIMNKEITGDVCLLLSSGITTGTQTAAGAASGGMNLQIGGGFQSIGTTLPSTLADAYPPGMTGNPLRALFLNASSSRIQSMLLVRMYKIGTVNFTATGQRFTHDAATFPVTRTQMGQSQNVPLIPFLYMTTNMSTTAAIFTIKYVNQAGTTVTGARTFTMPAINTALQSCFFFNLENTLSVGGRWDNAIQDMLEINVTTASAAGIADVWGMEILGATGVMGATNFANKNFCNQGFSLPDINPALPTSGTLISKLAPIGVGSSATMISYYNLKAFVDS